MQNSTYKMPVLFLGHGSPMNAIENNEFTGNWERIAGQIRRPEAILCVSAHWYTEGIRLMEEQNPRQIYDMYGFPQELYELKYPVKGAPSFAKITGEYLSAGSILDNSWGIDHGAWSVLCRMYPKADIPVYQLSIDRTQKALKHFQIGQELSALREKGVLILGSGNVVHNLSKISWGMKGGYWWAEEFDGFIRDKIMERSFGDVVQYEKAGAASELAFFTPEHFYPLLYVLGAVREEDKVTLFNDSCIMGSLSMTSYLFE